MQIKLADIRMASEKIFESLEKQGAEVINIPVDYYWNIPKEQRYNPYQEPIEFDLGQLTDNWQELQKMLDIEAQPIVYHLVWLAAILRATGEHLVV